MTKKDLETIIKKIEEKKKNIEREADSLSEIYIKLEDLMANSEYTLDCLNDSIEALKEAISYIKKV